MLVGLKDRPTSEVRTEALPNQDPVAMRRFVRENVEEGAAAYTDGHVAYWALSEYAHQAVNPQLWTTTSWGRAHTNGIEGFWSGVKRAYTGTFHELTWKHLQRYADESSQRQNLREMDTTDVMSAIVDGMWSKLLTYDELTA